MLTSAPEATSTRTTSAWPSSAAKCSAVLPVPLLALTRAPVLQQHAGKLGVAVPGSLVQRGKQARALPDGLRVRPVLQQHASSLHVPSPRRRMQSRVTAEARLILPRAALQKQKNGIGVTAARRRSQRITCVMQRVLLPTGLILLHGSAPVHEQASRLRMPQGRREAQGGMPIAVHRIHIGPLVDEKPRDGGIPIPGGGVQGGAPKCRISGIHIRSLINQTENLLRPTLMHRPKEGLILRPLTCRQR